MLSEYRSQSREDFVPSSMKEKTRNTETQVHLTCMFSAHKHAIHSARLKWAIVTVVSFG